MGFTKKEYLELRQKASLQEFKDMRKGKRELSQKEKELKLEYNEK